MKTRKDLKILLIQIRDDEMKQHEQDRVINSSQIAKEQLDIVDIFHDRYEDIKLEKYDAVFIGGSGNYCVTENDLPNLDQLILFTREVYSQKIPLLGLCFGAHVLTEAIGGQLVHDKKLQEAGTYSVLRNEHGKHDPLLKDFPDEFVAVLGHKDHITKLPIKAVNLASSENSVNQIWTLPGEPVYAVQFHPELDLGSLIVRLDYYADKYIEDKDELNKIKEAAQPVSKQVTELIQDFLDKIVIEGQRHKID